MVSDVPDSVLAVYGCWYQVETWLRTVAYITLRAQHGVAWDGEVKAAQRYAISGRAMGYIASPDRNNLMAFLDTGKLFELIGKLIATHTWLEDVLFPATIWDARSLELNKIRRQVGHCRRPDRHDLRRLEQTLDDLETGSLVFLNAQTSLPVSTSLDDPVVQAWSGPALTQLRKHLQRKFELRIDLEYVTQPWATYTSGMAITGTPGLLWALDLGDPSRFLEPSTLWSRLAESTQRLLVNIHMAAPVGFRVTFAAVDNPSAIAEAFSDILTAYARSARPVESYTVCEAEAWPRDKDFLDPRILIDSPLALL